MVAFLWTVVYFTQTPTSSYESWENLRGDEIKEIRFSQFSAGALEARLQFRRCPGWNTFSCELLLVIHPERLGR